MRALPVADALGGIAAFYSILHLPRLEVRAGPRRHGALSGRGASRSWPSHLGEGLVHLDDLWGEPVAIDFQFFQAEEVAGLAPARPAFNGSMPSSTATPTPASTPSRRAYLLAQRPWTSRRTPLYKSAMIAAD